MGKPQKMNLPLTAILTGAILLTALSAGIFFGRLNNAYGIPAYARQLGVDCEQCHTIWPRLNAFGRKFKMKGYVDRGENPGLPIAARLMTTVTRTDTTPPGGPSSSQTLINFPSQVNLFIGTRLTPEIGIFSAFTAQPQDNGAGGKNWHYSVDEQKYAWNFLPGKPVSLVFFHSTIFGFDPFPSLGNLAFEGDYSDSPGIMNRGELLNPFDTSGFGLVAHGFLDQWSHLYGGIGVETGGAVPDTLALGVGANDTSHNGLDYVARLAYTDSIGDSGGSWNIGTAYYNGPQFPTIQLPTTGKGFTYQGNVKRLFFDGAVQLPVGENDLMELVGLYGSGDDLNYFTADPVLGKVGPFNGHVTGGFLQASYYWSRMYGVRATYDASTLNGVTSRQWQLGPVFLPTHDFKINANLGRQYDNQGNSTWTYQLIMTKMF